MDEPERSTEELLSELRAARERIAELERRTGGEDRFRLLVENSPDTIMTLDRQGVIRFMNRTLPEYRLEDVVGTSTFDYIDARDRERYRRTLEEVFETGEPRSIELSAAGSSWWLARLVPLSNGRPTDLVLAIASEITERKRAEEERRLLEAKVQHAQKLESLGVLAGGIAHDFNNLLTGILGSASLAAMRVSPGSPAAEQLGRILRSAEKAAELTNQMLSYSGRGQFVMTSIDLDAVVAEVLPLVRGSIPKAARLEVALARNLPTLSADRAQMQQVIVNLVTNAAEALVDGEGELTLRTGVLGPGAIDAPDHFEESAPEESAPVGGPRVFLEVTDTGAGMDEETQRRIFDPFFTTKFTGRGLGLAAVQGIVRAHGGAIRVESSPGRGTRVRIVFPAEIHEAADFPAPGTRPEPRGGTILVIDDEESVRSVARVSLEDSGFEVFTAEDGASALAVFDERGDRIDAVLLDMSMPHLNGEETLRALRERRPGLPVVLTSGYSEQEIVQRFKRSGFSVFVQKPFRATELVARMQEALAIARR